MAFCVLRTEKIKSSGQMSARYNHDYRKVAVKNADPNLTELNETYIQPDNNMNYSEAFDQTIKSLEYYQTHKFRKDAVRAIDVMTALPSDSECDIDEWKQANAKWIKDYFNVGGRNNVISLVYHMDEGAIHCHAVVIPIDEKGKLNASLFLNGSRKLSEMQTSYANAMKEFGLQRGVKGSSAKHTDIRRYYTELNDAIQKIEKPKENETAEEYRERFIMELGTARAANLKIMNDIKTKQRQQVDYERMLARQNMQQEAEETRKETKAELQALQNEYNETYKRLLIIQRELEMTEKELKEKEEKYKQLEAEYSVTNSKVEFFDNFQILFQKFKKEKGALYEEMHHILSSIEKKSTCEKTFTKNEQLTFDFEPNIQ